MFFIPAGAGRAVCILQFPRLSKAGCPDGSERHVRPLLPHPLELLFCFNFSHHSLNRCALISPRLLVLGTNGGIKNVVVNKSENVSDLDGCCSLTANSLNNYQIPPRTIDCLGWDMVPLTRSIGRRLT